MVNNMPKTVSSAIHHRQSIGNHIRSQDKKQKSYRDQNNLVKQLARQQGLSAENRHRRNLTQAMLGLFSILSSVKNNNSTSIITQGDINHNTDVECYSLRGLRGTISNKDYLPYVINNVSDIFIDNLKEPALTINSNDDLIFKPVRRVLHHISQFIYQHDPLRFPTVGATPINEKKDIPHNDKLPNDFINRGDYLRYWHQVIQNGTDHRLNEKMIEFINDAFVKHNKRYHSKYPDLIQLAHDKLKDEIFRKYDIDINPDEICFMRFSNTMYLGHDKIHFLPAHENKTLTEWLFTNFDLNTLNNMQDMEALSGLYKPFPIDNKAYHSTEAINIKPTEFIDLVWSIDFYNYAKDKIIEKYENKTDHVNKAIIDFVIHIGACVMDAEHINDVLKCIGGVECNNMVLSSFDINGYLSSNAFVLRNILTKNVIIYFPKSDFKFKQFNDDNEMRTWIADICVDKNKRKMIASHFSLKDSQDGIIYDGVNTWLSSINQDHDKKEKIVTNKKYFSSEYFFDLLVSNMKDREISDLDYLVKSDAEVRIDMWEEMIDASSIIPNPLSPLLSLGMHVEHLIDADSFDEKKQELSKIKNDIVNIALFILTDAFSGRVNIESSFLVDEAEAEAEVNGIANNVRKNNYEVTNNCHRVARGIVYTKFCAAVNHIDDFFDSERVENSSGSEFISMVLPKLNNPPGWFIKENILKKEVSADGVIFIDPSKPDRIIKFYKKKHSEVKANNNVDIFRKLYENESVNVFSLTSDTGDVFIAIDMPKLSGSTLADIRARNDVTSAVAIAKEIIRKDPVARLIENLQRLNINIKDFNVGNIIFDAQKRAFFLIDFDYADTASILNDSHYASMYISLQTKIKQDFLAIKWFGTLDKNNHFIQKAIKKTDARLTVIIMDGNKPRIKNFRESIDKYNVRNKNHISGLLKKWINSDMLSDSVDLKKLSPQNEIGIRQDSIGNEFITYNKKVVKIERDNGGYFIQAKNRDRINLVYKNEMYYPEKIITQEGLVSSSIKHERMTNLINSPNGLQTIKNRILNKSWVLSKSIIKNNNIINEKFVGSKIDLTFTLVYKNRPGVNEFIEIPTLKWNENIKFKQESGKWVCNHDMYDLNPESRTFFSWNNRYVEAYYFAKTSDKVSFNGNVKIYNNDFKTLSPDDIAYAASPSEMISNVKKYLVKNGGIIEVTITDLPRILRSSRNLNIERVVNFDISFDEKNILKFHQGIYLDADNVGKAFVSMSDDIKLASGKVTRMAPLRVTRPRVTSRLKRTFT